MKTKQTTGSALRLYRFGPYELDLERNELCKFGFRVNLEPKPMQLLLALVDRSGELVRRSELQELLWGRDIFVHFDKGLNVAVTKLRAALNDPSETPKYVETVTREGYRFIAAVERVFAASEWEQFSTPPESGRTSLVPCSGQVADNCYLDSLGSAIAPVWP